MRSPAEILRSYYAFYVSPAVAPLIGLVVGHNMISLGYHHHDNYQVAKQHPFVEGKTIDEWALDWTKTGSSVGPVWRFYKQLWLCHQHIVKKAEEKVSDSQQNQSGNTAASPMAAVVAFSNALDQAPFVLVEYRALCKDKAGYARRLAKWMQGSSDTSFSSDENIQKAVDLCSREAMAAAVTKYDDHWLYQRQVFVADCRGS